MAVDPHEATMMPEQLGEAFAETLASFDGEVAPTAGGRAPEPFPTGEARYVPGRVLGQGGMGKVYVAKDIQFGREVAVKEMLAEHATTESMKRFLLEAVVTGNLEHPGIPAVYERGLRDGRLFYAMRKVEGRTLADTVRGARTFESRVALLPALVRVAHTLGFAHARGVVHRDVKPDNIVLGDHGETVLLDWGIARVAKHSLSSAGSKRAPVAPAPAATLDGQVMGTPAYMAPEQAAGRVDEIDARTDVFALGALLYHVLTGVAPYDGPSTAASLAYALEGRRDGVQKRAPETPPALAEVLETAMAQDPADRYPNAAAFADALEAFLTQSVTDRPSAWVRGIVSVVGAALLLFTVGLAVMVTNEVSPFRAQGAFAYIYTGLALLGLLSGGVDWGTRGRHHLGPLTLALGFGTALMGIAGTLVGYTVVIEFVRENPDIDRGDALLQGLWEVAGSIPTSAAMATAIFILWALARRRHALAQEASDAIPP